MEELRRTFRPEFLNRIDDIVVFHKLGRAELDRIVDMQLARLRKLLADRRPRTRAHARGDDVPGATRGTTRRTARGRSSARSCATCRIRWRAGFSRASSHPGDTILVGEAARRRDVFDETADGFTRQSSAAAADMSGRLP